MFGSLFLQLKKRDGSFLEKETLKKEKKADDVQGRHISKKPQHLQKHILNTLKQVRTIYLLNLGNLW